MATWPVTTNVFSRNELRGTWEQERDDVFSVFLVVALCFGVAISGGTRYVIKKGGGWKFRAEAKMGIFLLKKIGGGRDRSQDRPCIAHSPKKGAEISVLWGLYLIAKALGSLGRWGSWAPQNHLLLEFFVVFWVRGDSKDNMYKMVERNLFPVVSSEIHFLGLRQEESRKDKMSYTVYFRERNVEDFIISCIYTWFSRAKNPGHTLNDMTQTMFHVERGQAIYNNYSPKWR